MTFSALQLTPAELQAYLADGVRPPLAVTLTRNRVSLIRLRVRPGGGLELRANAGLLRAPPEVLRALKRFLVSHRRSDWRAVCDWFQAIPRESRPVPDARLRTAGRVHDLRAVLDRVNAAWFPGPCPTRITWGKAAAAPSRRRARRQIAYGSYHKDPDLIRVHPLLDDPRVPEEFVAFIVFHERLHAALGAEARGGRNWHHTRSFRNEERRFPGYERMKELARTLIATLDRRPPP